MKRTKWRLQWVRMPSKRRFQVLYGALLLLAVVAIPVGVTLSHKLQARRYNLSSATKQLIGNPAPGLDAQLAYNKQAQAFQYNPDASKGISNLTSGGDNGARIGGSKYYGVVLDRAASKGQTFTDASTKLSFSIAPDFGTLGGKHLDGHVVYPFSKGQLIYTLKDNGLREDVVLPKPVDNISLKYKLSLPDTLSARVEPDGSLGIYSASPALFGNISYGGSSDQQAVQKARTNGQKNNLVFMLPAPVITASQGTSTASKAHFSLNGSTLSVVADGLRGLHYPISIDPSVVVQSANSFNLGNNEDNNASIGTSSVGRGSLTGGVVNAYAADTTCATAGAWCAVNTGASGYNGNATPANSGARMNATLAYNGFLYSIGGNYNNNTNSIGTVSYAAINASNGSIGSWNVGSTLIYSNGGLSNFGSAVYNGYLYVIGGYNQGSASQSTIQYALICTGNNAGQAGCTSTPGSVGTWTQSTTSTNFATVDSVPQRVLFALIAYNGYMYAIGGANGNSNAFTTSVLYAPILANGDLGNWSTTASLPTKGSVVATVYNGYIYAGVTCNSGNTILGPGGCTATTSLLIGTISPSGGISSWTTTGTPTFSLVLGNLNGYPSIVAVSGYLYVIGGNQGTTLYSSVYYAPIYANGGVGTVQTTSSLTAAVGEARAAAYNGYIYQVGGYYDNGNANTYYSGTQYAKIDPVGPTGSYVTASHSLTTATANAGSLAYGGYLYQIGGSQSTSSSVTTVYYASLSASGDVGTWGTTSALSSAVYGMGVAAYNGYVYVVDGNTSPTYATSPTNLVQYAQINSNGTLGSWASAGSTTVASTMYPTTVAYNGYIYRMGGYASGTVNSVEYAPINTNGTLGTWNYTHNGTNDGGGFVSGFTTSRWQHASVVNGGYVYILGGHDSSITTYSDVQYALLCTTTNSGQGGCTGTAGTVGTWNTTTSLNTARSGFTAAVSNGYLYVSGGCSAWTSNIFPYCTTYQNDTQYAKLTASGAIATDSGCGSAWCSAASFTTARAFQAGAVYNGYLYVYGGCSATGTNPCPNAGTIYSDVQYAPLNNGGGGSSGAWSSATNLPTNLGAQGSIALNGYLYVIGGCGGLACVTGAQTKAYHIAINPDGSLGATWTTDTAMPTQRACFGLAAYNGVLYVLGGCGNAGNQNGGYYTTPDPVTGNITSWSNTTSFTVPRQYLRAAAYNGYLYITGGTQSSASTLCNSTSTKTCSDVQYAPINNDGSLGPWHFTYNSADNGTTYAGGFATSRQIHTMAISNGYMYILGGQNEAGTTLSDVQYAPINANGTVGTWLPTTSMTTPRSTQLTYIYNGYLYAYGGGGIASAEYAPISNNGTIGNWTISVLPLTGNAATYGYMSGALANGYIYAMGGQNSPSISNTVQYSPIQVQPRVAHYSYLVDLKSTSNDSVGGDPQITRFGLGLTPTSASSVVTACWQGATTAAPSGNNVFGTSTCVNNLSNKVPAAWRSYGRYAFAYITLDDSQSATFPDSSQTTLTELDTYFHAAANRRLRMGQTFTNMGTQSGTQNQLDTEGP